MTEAEQSKAGAAQAGKTWDVRGAWIEATSTDGERFDVTRLMQYLNALEARVALLVGALERMVATHRHGHGRQGLEMPNWPMCKLFRESRFALAEASDLTGTDDAVERGAEEARGDASCN